MEGYFGRVVETLTAAGYRWYETANFCRADDERGRDLRSRHNLGYWLGHDYLGIGVGAVSTAGDRRWRNTPRLPRDVAALPGGEEPARAGGAGAGARGRGAARGDAAARARDAGTAAGRAAPARGARRGARRRRARAR